MNKIRKGDEIIVIAGKDKGKTGTVTALQAGDKIVVEGINIAKKHEKPNPNNGVVGGIVDKSMPIHISNVSYYNKVSSKPDKIFIKTLKDGKKSRALKSNQEVIDI